LWPLGGLGRRGYSRADFERAMEELFVSKEIGVMEYRNSYRNVVEKLIIN
jgi:hypothetical protein